MNPQVAIIGFKSDEGVRRNNGRPGAAEGPDEIRAHHTRMASHLDPERVSVADLGDVTVMNGDLEAAQAVFSGMVAHVHQHQSAYSIGLGGGHEIAFAHAAGLLDAYPHHVIGMLNIDAHFDLRPYRQVGSTSGTPFLQIHDRLRVTHRPFRYLVLGIQSQSNAPFLFETARTTNTAFITADAIQDSDAWMADLDAFLDACDLLYLSIDMDVFPSHAAPGVSAPNGAGLDPTLVMRAFRRILRSGKVKAFDIAELNPTYDDANRGTARLAASFLHRFLHSL
jgi:formiminoglutamase